MKSIILMISALVLTVNIHSQNLLNGPDDIVFDAKHNRYLIGNWAGNRIVEVDSSGNQRVFKSNLPNCHGLELFGDTLYVSAQNRIFGININDAQTIKDITVPGSTRLGHMTLDTLNNILYVSDWDIKKLFKVNINTSTPSVLVDFGAEIPVGVLIDPNFNRLILLTFGVDTPIKAVNLSNGQVTNITSTGYNYLGAITRDKYNCVYVSAFAQGLVYRFDSVFSAAPLLISSGHNQPSGFGYNGRDHILGVTNYNSNSYSLITLPVISVKNISNKTESFLLFQNYPNPFNPKTNIKYQIVKSGNVKLIVFDITGREIITLVDKNQNAGTYPVDFSGNGLSSGVYFYKIIINTGKEAFTETKKMLMIK